MDEKSLKDRAIEKINSSANNRFEKIIGKYLIKRCREDPSVAEDVLKEDRTMEKCQQYIISKAYRQRKVAFSKGSCVIADDQTVFEWAEDYFHAVEGGDPDLENANKVNAAVKISTDASTPQPKKKRASKPEPKEKNSRTHKAKEQKPVKKDEKEDKWQMSLFDYFGQGGSNG